MKTKRNIPDALPSQAQLATLALHSRRKTPGDAVRHALAVWREAGAALRAEADAQAGRAFGDVPLPRSFPATFADFLRLVVRGKTQADSLALLRRFYRESKAPCCATEDEAATRAVNELAAWKQGGFQTPAAWGNLARRFIDWRSADKSQRARDAASKRTVTHKAS